MRESTEIRARTIGKAIYIDVLDINRLMTARTLLSNSIPRMDGEEFEGCKAAHDVITYILNSVRKNNPIAIMPASGGITTENENADKQAPKLGR